MKHLEEQTETNEYAFILQEAEPQLSAKPQSNELEELMVPNWDSQLIIPYWHGPHNSRIYE